MAIREFLAAVFRSWVGAVGIFLTVFPFIEKLPRVKEWLQDKPFLERYAWLLWIVGGLCIVYGFYDAWFQQREIAITSQQKLDGLSKPQLTGELLQIIRGDISNLSSGELSVRVFLLVSIKNLGSPSIADSFLVTVEKGELKKTERLVFIPDGYTVTGGTDSHVIATFKRGDALYEKTASPIERGDKKTGWLMVDFKGIRNDEISGPGVKFTVQCSDVTGKLIYTVFTTNDTSGSEPLTYFPGSEQPFKGIKKEDLHKK
jgi:hypothetical protein